MFSSVSRIKFEQRIWFTSVHLSDANVVGYMTLVGVLHDVRAARILSALAFLVSAFATRFPRKEVDSVGSGC